MHLLGALSLHPGAGMAELSEILVLERSTLVRNLKLLERAGLVVASRPAGSRAKRFDVTDAGRRLFASLEPLREQAHQRLLVTPGPDGFAVVRGAWARLRAAPRPAPPP